VSADRRYVFLTVQTAVSKIEGFNSIGVTAIAGGQLVNSADTSSFIQTPTVTVTEVNTSVTVPDQGTILLGGQRLITESQVETGVPVLSKIPILNRFFTNRTETKEEQTLLILIKPTILIQTEEEDRHFPGLEETLKFSGR
jgi:type II secretory pathway component GspD/PulD (secretin)